jgi:tetratricopeptide (TPR) repeat protein
MNATLLAKWGSRPDITEPPTTDGVIAILNLQAQIDGLETQIGDQPTVEGQVALIELITLRGLILGLVSDYERAGILAERLVNSEAADGAAYVARARTRATFHRFADALKDLDVAEGFSWNADAVKIERAAILQALGRYDEALAIQDVADRRPNFESLGALAGLLAERGEIESAERLYQESRSCYRGVSPLPLALLDFQRGLMWMHNGRWDDARTWFESARRCVPAFAPAQGHLAEVEAELGDTDTAIARLVPLSASSDDPDYVAQLARILREIGRTDESDHWCRLAAARYDELVGWHPEAFADHAAEFWLGAGADPNKALWLARLNFDVRKTPRARELLAHAIDAAEIAGPAVCASPRRKAGGDRPLGGNPC